ncbi:EAL domain-containing protein [Trinickia sp. LjRoot230]|uniref:putative bifunctional diguanylate cyclase/phosphodiesterase n=1 Tax=Trinickia sp. LjRoot230 TaxID=3342288 RepID=UPI003ECEA940
MIRKKRETPSPTREMARIKMLRVGVALLVASLVLLVYQAATLRASLTDDANMLAEMIADNSAASVMFNDKTAAGEVLHSLTNVPYVESATIYTTTGAMVASYLKAGLDDAERADSSLANARVKTGPWSLRDVVAESAIEVKGKSVGTVVLVAATGAMLAQLMHYAGFLAAASLAAIWLAFAVTSRMGARVAQAEKELEYLAATDPLTGLPNRREFYDELDRRLHRPHHADSRMALVLVDLDDFKTVNDTLGHGAGDELLKRVASALRQAVRTTDVVSRIGGDEFAVLIEIREEKAEARLAAERIARTLARPFNLPRASVVASASVGVSVFPDDATDVASLVSSADIALYAAKSRGKHTAVEFHPSMTIAARRRARLEAELRKAIDADVLDLVYQPQFDCRTGAIIGAEALLRWVHPADGAVSPAEFIPIAEDSDLIVTLGQWVLRRACRDAARWNEHSGSGIYVAVNVSACQLRKSEFDRDVQSVLEQSGLSSHLLELELTESQLMANMSTGVESMLRLRALGVRLALDDFGTGYSSLSYLQSFPVNSLKIDRSFIHPLPHSGQPIVTAIISMAHSFGIAVVAEGVEEPTQLAWLSDAGCDIVQGFLTGRPMSFDQLMHLLGDALAHPDAGADAGPDPDPSTGLASDSLY